MPEFKQLHPEGIRLTSAIATFTLAVGTSIALSRPLPPRPTQLEYNSESAVSPAVRDLKREIDLAQNRLLAHNAATEGDPEVVEAQVDRSYVSRATAAAAAAPHVALSADDHTALMATPTYSPRLLDIDYDEE